MSDIISSLSVSLNLDAQRYQKEVEKSKQETTRLQKELQNVQKVGQEAIDSLTSHFVKDAKQIKRTVDDIGNSIQDIRDKGLTVPQQNRIYAMTYGKNGKGRKTDPYLKAGAGWAIDRLLDAKSMGKMREYLKLLSGGIGSFVGKNAKTLSKLNGFNSEYEKQLRLQKQQLEIFGQVNQALKTRKQLLGQIAVDEKALAKLQASTPKYTNTREYKNLLERLNANQARVASETRYIDEMQKSDLYKQARVNAKRFGVVYNKESGKFTDFQLKELAQDQAYQNAKLVHSKKQELDLQNQITRSIENTNKAERKRLRSIEQQSKLQERQARNLERQKYYLQRDIRGGLSDVLMFGGGAFLGDRMIRGAFESVAKLQKMESQVDTWGLNKKDRLQFDVIADRILKSSPLLSRAEAIDATLAGMTSMGHFDPNALKMVLPEAVKYAQGSKILGYTDDTIANVIKNYFGVVEARQQTMDPGAMLKTFKTLWQVENVTGGKVTVKDFETILRNLGPGAPLMTDEGLLNLVAFAEQIKVAGHGGGGGAGAGISTVGNLIKMLQLTASGKPTSINAKKMMAELFNINPDGSMKRLLDTDVDGNATSGGVTFVQAMSNMKNIAQQTMEILGGADKAIAKAGFADKQGMWDDPVKTMGAMREAFLRGTYTDRNGNWDEKKARTFYRDDQIDFKNKKLKNVNVLDEQKAITSLIAQMGFQHRTTTAMATFMNPFFLKRSGYTIESAKNQISPGELFLEQYKKGNWNVASQEFTTAMTRLGESMKPLVADFADLTRTVSKFITAIAEFNESHPLLTTLNGMLAATVALAPAVGMVAMAFERLNGVANSRMALKALETAEKRKAWEEASGWVSNVGPKSPRERTETLKQHFNGKIGFNTQLPTAYEELDGFCKKVNSRLFRLYTSVSSIVTKIGGLFLRMIPAVGTALLAFDLGSIVAHWFADLEVKVDGETKRIGDIIDEKLSELKAKWEAHGIFWEKEKETIKKVQQQHQAVDDIENIKLLISEFAGQAFTEKLRTQIVNGQVSPSGYIEDPQTAVVGANGETVSELVSLLQNKGFLRNDFDITSSVNRDDMLKELINALIKLEQTEGLLKDEVAKGYDKPLTTHLRQDKNGYVQYERTAEFEKGDQISALFKDYEKKFKEAEDRILNGKIYSTYFNTQGNDQPIEFANLYKYREQVLKHDAKTDEEKKKKAEELARVDKQIADARAEEYDSLTNLCSVIKDSKEAIFAFSNLLRGLTNEQFRKMGLTSLTADKIGMSNWVYGVIQQTIANKGGSAVDEASKLYYAGENSHVVTDKNGKKAWKGSPNTQLADNKKGGTPPTYYVPQNVKFLNTLQAQINEGKANTLSLLAGQGKKGMGYAKAFVLQKLLNGGLSKSNKDPQDSPYLINKKNGLTAENVDWNKKDPVTGLTLTQLAEKKYLAEQFKLAENAASKFAQSTAKAEEDLDAASELVANGGVEKLPTAISSLNREAAKLLSQIDKNSPVYKLMEENANHAKAVVAHANLKSSTASDMKEIKAFEAERLAYGMNSTNASWTKYQADRKQQTDNFNFKIANLEKQKANLKDAKEIEAIDNSIVEARKTFTQKMSELDQKWLRDNATAGQQLVVQWTDLSKALDDLQSEMMNGFIDMTEQMLDGNLDSWRDYAYNLLRLIRRQILQGTFAPLLSQITGMMNQGIAGFFGNDVEAMRQRAGYYQADNTANVMLGNGFYSNFVAGNYFRRPQANPYDTYYSPYYTQNYSSALMSDDTGAQIDYTGSINDGTAVFASSNAQTSWWNSFTTSFSEGIGGLWNSTKNFFGNFGDNMGKLSDGFLEFCGSPLESLKNAFSSASTVIGQFIMSLSSGSSGSGVGGIISGVIGAVAGAVGSAMGAPSGEFGLKGMGYDPSAASNANYFAEAGKKALSGSAWTRFAKGGVMSSNGELDLRKYASGGIANSPQLAVFGEGSMPEAYVPLPDGRSIPVSFRGNGTGDSVGGNNISIVINVSNTNNTSTETQSSDATSAGKDSSDMAKLANRIKMLVRQEIVTQSRPGGLLAGA
nr:MAG TPA: hypothetical protein [Caudoviricetes sp.]